MPSVIAALPFVRSLADRPPPQHFGGDDEHGHEQQHDRRHRRERRVHLQQQVVPHPPRQGRGAAAGDEQRDRQLVERGDEGKQEAGQDAAADLRQRDVDERAPSARAEAPGGLIEPLVIGLQHRHDRDDDVRHGEDGVPDDEPQDRADEADAGIEVEQPDGDDDPRQHQRREDQAEDDAAAGDPLPHEHEGRRRAEHRRRGARQERDDEGPHGRGDPVRRVEVERVPAQREALRRELDEVAGGERHRDHEEGRQAQEGDDQGARDDEHAARGRALATVRPDRDEPFPNLPAAVAQPAERRDEPAADRRAEPAERTRRSRGPGLGVGAGQAREAEQPVVEQEDQGGRDEQHDRKRARKAPVQHLLDDRDDDLRDHRLLPPAEQRRRDEEAERADEHQEAGRGDARDRHAEEDLPEGAAAPRAEGARGADEGLVEALHHRQHRHHGERHHRVHHADHRAGEVVDQRQRRVGDAEREQQLVHGAVAPEQDHPREGPDEEARPERHQDEDGEDIPGPRPRRREEIRDRIAGKEREGRGPGRDLQRDAERPQVHRRRRRPQVVLGRQLAGPVDQAEPQDLQDGVEEERDDQQQQRVERPGADPAGARQRRPGTAATGRDRGCHATPSTSVWSPRHPTRMRVPGGGTAAPPSVSCFRDSTRSSAIDT